MTKPKSQKLNDKLCSLIFERESNSDQRFIRLGKRFIRLGGEYSVALQTIDFTGRTLLDIAVRYQRPAIVRYLVTIAKADPDATRSALINGFKDIEEILIRRWPEHKSEKQKLETRLDSKLLAGLSRTCKRILAQKLYITPALHRTDSGIDSPGWYQHQIESA